MSVADLDDASLAGTVAVRRAGRQGSCWIARPELEAVLRRVDGGRPAGRCAPPMAIESSDVTGGAVKAPFRGSSQKHRSPYLCPPKSLTATESPCATGRADPGRGRHRAPAGSTAVRGDTAFDRTAPRRRLVVVDEASMLGVRSRRAASTSDRPGGRRMLRRESRSGSWSSPERGVWWRRGTISPAAAVPHIHDRGTVVGHSQLIRPRGQRQTNQAEAGEEATVRVEPIFDRTGSVVAWFRNGVAFDRGSRRYVTPPRSSVQLSRPLSGPASPVLAPGPQRDAVAFLQGARGGPALPVYFDSAVLPVSLAPPVAPEPPPAPSPAAPTENWSQLNWNEFLVEDP